MLSWLFVSAHHLQLSAFRHIHFALNGRRSFEVRIYNFGNTGAWSGLVLMTSCAVFMFYFPFRSNV